MERGVRSFCPIFNLLMYSVYLLRDVDNYIYTVRYFLCYFCANHKVYCAITQLKLFSPCS